MIGDLLLGEYKKVWGPITDDPQHLQNNREFLTIHKIWKLLAEDDSARKCAEDNIPITYSIIDKEKRTYHKVGLHL